MGKNDVSAGITCFIDILGFSEKILAATTIDEVTSIKTQLMTIQKEFNFNSKDELIKENRKHSKTTILAFSDCVVVNIPLESKTTKYHGTFDPIMCEFASFAYAQGTCVQNKIFVRGGIDIGWWSHDKHLLVSGSLTRAYKLEAKANVPVIALTPEVYEYFANHKHRKYYSKDVDPLNILRKYESDNLSFWYIDYIKLCVEALGWQRSKHQVQEYREVAFEEKDRIRNDGYVQNTRDWLSSHARIIEEAYSSVTDQKIKDKYIWLSQYHNDIVASYTNFDECICRV